MSAIVAILLGVISLAVLVFAFLASKVWHWAHVVTLVAFYFATVGYAILGARSLSARQEHQKKYASQVELLAKQTELTDGLARGVSSANSQLLGNLARQDVLAARQAQEAGADMPGTGDLQHKLRIASRIRGRVWRGARPGNVDPASGTVNVLFPVARPAATEDGEPPIDGGDQPTGPPPPIGIEVDSIVYVFEQGPVEGVEQDPAPNQYVGEFRVAEVQGREAVLDPLDQLELDPVAQERLLQSNGPWIVYENMPADSRDLFAGLDEETLRRLLPEASVEEFLRDGQESTPDDPPSRTYGVDADGGYVSADAPDQVVRTLYRRRLRDYAYLLNDFERERATLVAREQSLTADIAKLNLALEDAKKVEQYRREEFGNWQSDLDNVERERRAIEAHVAALQEQVANAKRLLDETLQQNAQLAVARVQQRGVLLPISSGSLDIDAL